MSAPRLAWGLFGYKQTLNRSRIGALIDLARTSQFFIRTTFEKALYTAIDKYHLATSLNKIPVEESLLSNKMVNADVVSVIAGFNPEFAHLNRRVAVASTKAGVETRKKQITSCLLKAVANGMESKEVNTSVSVSDAGSLFKSHLYTKELLQKSPEYLLEHGDVIDWAGRTFKNITVFEYALWAKDFKMIQMMLECIPNTPDGDLIRADLCEQYKRVTDPIYTGGGLTYTHTYDRPNIDTAGIPDGTTTSVTEVHTENHFNIVPLCDAYQGYDTHYKRNIDGSVRTWPQRYALWTWLIGKLQRFLPVHILQRYCDPDRPFSPLPQFDGAFRRSTFFYDYTTNTNLSFFCFPISSDFALSRGPGCMPVLCNRWHELDLPAVRQLDKVSTNEIEKISRQLSQPQHAAELRA